MKKGKLLIFTFCLPILFLLLINSVRAEETCLREPKMEKLTDSSKKITIPDLNESNHNFYRFNLEGYLAFCLDPGKRLTGSGEKYTLESKVPISVPILLKAYTYSKNHSDDEKARLAAQIIFWAYSYKNNIGSTSEEQKKLEDYIKQGFKTYYSLSESDARQEAQKYWNYINKDTTPTPGLKLYRWKYVTGGKNSVQYNASDYQNIITEFELEACVPESSCYLETFSNLAKCNLNGENQTNTGVITQIPKGDCKDEFTKDDFNISGKYTNELGPYCRMYCLDSFNEYYPGGIDKRVTVGTYIVWPHSFSFTPAERKAFLDVYPMENRLTKDCKIYVDTESIKKRYNFYKALMKKYPGGAKNFKDGGNSCDTYDANTKEAKSAYDKCMKTKNEYRGTNSDGSYTSYETQEECAANHTQCSTVKINDNSACTNNEEKKYNDAKTISDECNAYKDAYDKAKKVISDVNSCGQADIKLNENYNITYEVSYNDPKYGRSYNLTDTSSSSCTGCNDNKPAKITENPVSITTNQLINSAKEIENRKISASFSKRYNLSNDGNNLIYNYIDKNTGKSTSSIKNIANRFSTIGFSIMPISHKAKKNKIYDLSISIVNVTGTSFDEEILNRGKYTCHYKVIDDTPKPCECPENTENSGESYEQCVIAHNFKITDSETGILIDTGKGTASKSDYGEKTTWKCNDLTMACESTKDEYQAIMTEYCREDAYQCPSDSDHPEVNLTTCIEGEGKKFKECVELCYDNTITVDDHPLCVGRDCTRLTCPPNSANPDFDFETCLLSNSRKTCLKKCNDHPDDYKCPKGTSKEDMPIDSCVSEQISKNPKITVQEAIEACVDTVCNIKSGGNIIYRTISLSNPFPSYNSDSTVSQQNLKVGIFNDTIKGRYPGSNWNSSITVNTKILYNRSSKTRTIDGDEVYSVKPLYKFVLDSKTIKAIRKYNNQHKYDDFNLTCKLNNSAACMSNFVRNKTYGLTDGVCSNTTNEDDFYSCLYIY